jgi:hypothetical protein
VKLDQHRVRDAVLRMVEGRLLVQPALHHASKRPPSTVPEQVGVRLLGRSDADAQRLSPVVH